MNTDLRLTDTNAASDSKGRTWGLEGNLIWWLIGGIAAGIVLFFFMVLVFKAGLFRSFAIAVAPVLLCLIYILGLRHGKPPGYDRDCLEYWTCGTGFSPEPQGSTPIQHPLTGGVV